MLYTFFPSHCDTLDFKMSYIFQLNWLKTSNAHSRKPHGDAGSHPARSTEVFYTALSCDAERFTVRLHGVVLGHRDTSTFFHVCGESCDKGNAIRAPRRSTTELEGNLVRNTNVLSQTCHSLRMSYISAREKKLFQQTQVLNIPSSWSQTESRIE
jgi:hypothetical protein